MPAYKGYNPLGPGDAKPWGSGDLQHEKDVIDSIVMDCISSTKDLTGHKHHSLYDGYGVKAFTSSGKALQIGYGSDHTLTVDVNGLSSSAMRLRSGGYSFIQYDGPAKTVKMGEVGGDHKVALQLGYGTPSFDVKRYNGISALKVLDSGGGYLGMDNDVRIGGQAPDISGDNATLFMSIDRTRNWKQFSIKQWGFDTASGAVVPGLANYNKPNCLLLEANIHFDQMLFVCHQGDHVNPMWMGFLVGDNYGKPSPQIEIGRDSVGINAPIIMDGERIQGAGWLALNTSAALAGTPNPGTVWIWVDAATGYLIKVKDSTGVTRTLAYV